MNRLNCACIEFGCWCQVKVNWEDPAPSGIWNVLIKSFDEDFDNVTKLNKLDWIMTTMLNS